MRNTAFNITTSKSPSVTTSSRLRQSTALQFEPLTLLSIPTIVPLLSMSRSRANDFTVGGLMMWAKYFNYEFCVYGNTLFVKGVSELRPEEPAFSLPMGAMPLSCAVDLIMDYCRVNHTPLRFSAIPDDRLDDLRSIVPGRVELLDDWSDYIYDAHALANLPGRALNKKRNHVNRFMQDHPNYKIEPLDYTNLVETRREYTRWQQTIQLDRATAIEESLRTLDVLDNYSFYPFVGLVLRDDAGHIIGFTIGEIVGDTLYTHIEKVDHSVAGVGETINKLFAKYIIEHFPRVKYINREEDAGDPGLRQSKMSYHPSIILHKYDIIAK